MFPSGIDVVVFVQRHLHRIAADQAVTCPNEEVKFVVMEVDDGEGGDSQAEPVFVGDKELHLVGLHVDAQDVSGGGAAEHEWVAGFVVSHLTQTMQTMNV